MFYRIAHGVTLHEKFYDHVSLGFSEELPKYNDHGIILLHEILIPNFRLELFF